MTITQKTGTELKTFLMEQGYTNLKECADGTYIGLLDYVFTTDLTVGLTEKGYQTRFCYKDSTEAVVALSAYEPNKDPIGPWEKAKSLNEVRLNPLWCSRAAENVMENSVAEESLFGTTKLKMKR